MINGRWSYPQLRFIKVVNEEMTKQIKTRAWLEFGPLEYGPNPNIYFRLYIIGCIVFLSKYLHLDEICLLLQVLVFSILCCGTNLFTPIVATSYRDIIKFVSLQTFHKAMRSNIYKQTSLHAKDATCRRAKGAAWMSPSRRIYHVNIATINTGKSYTQHPCLSICVACARVYMCGILSVLRGR